MKKPKTITVSDEVMDNLENAFKKLRKEGIKNEKKKDDYYIPFPDSKLKSIFGFTDEEIEELHKSSK
jgi:DNA replicative helicase MCM subunit Mcm2 (Cdc46/Mcm family)